MSKDNKCGHVIVEDDSGHAYLIPKEDRDTFYEMLEEIEETGDLREFHKKFDKCMIGGVYNLVIYDWEYEK